MRDGSLTTKVALQSKEPARRLVRRASALTRLVGMKALRSRRTAVFKGHVAACVTDGWPAAAALLLEDLTSQG